MNSFSVLLRALVLFVIASRGSSRPPSLRVTPPDSFDYTLKGESLKLIKVKDDGRVSQLQDISPGVYSLKLAGTRTGGCGFKGGSDEYLGFNNRTCTSSLEPSKTAGPVMRGPSSSMMWREWMVTVQKKEDDRVDVSLQAFVHPALEDQGKCLGYVSNYYGNPKFKGSCLIPPYGNGLFLNGTENTASKASSNPQVLTMKAAGEGEFEITAANKPGECARALAVEDCDGHAVLVEDPVKYFADSKKYTTWILTKRYDVVASASAPSPAPSPTPPAVAPSPRTPPPPAPIPGPRIEPSMYGQSIVTSGFIEVSVKSTGGNEACSVESITFTAVNTAIGESASTPAYNVANLQQLPATVPLTGGYLYEVYAVGTCSNGGVTEKSNVLTIQSSSAGQPVVPQPYTCNPACQNPLVCRGGYCVPDAPLVFILEWDSASSQDLDLWVSYNLQASCTIYYGNKGTASSLVCGGFLFKDSIASQGYEVTAYSNPASGTYYVAIDPFSFSGSADIRVAVYKSGVGTTLLPASPATSAPLPTCATPYTTIPSYTPSSGQCLGYTVTYP